MRASPYRWLLPLGIGLLALAAGLFFFHPLAPLFLLGSLLIQIPIIVILTRVNMNKGYEQRVLERRLQYQQDGDAVAWLAAEEREARGAGFTYWSTRAKTQSALNRAELMCTLQRPDDAATLLAELDTEHLDKAAKARFDEMVQAIRAQNGTGG